MPLCAHSSLCFDVSPHAEEVGYQRPTAQQRQAATQPSGRIPQEQDEFGQVSASTYSAPLVLPGDELSWNPKYAPQSVRSWTQSRHRNAVTDQRRTIYVVPPPAIEDEMAHLSAWTIAQAKTQVTRPSINDLVSYLEAFYHGLPVKNLESTALHFTAWHQAPKSGRSIRACNKSTADVGLRTASNMVHHIRSRKYDGCYGGQLNLNDLLDVAIRILPDDAFALIMLVDHDMYEDEEDDFCCGRAYGGSRISVVSSARYNPALDRKQKVEREHAWPTSHCLTYVQDQCGVESAPSPPQPGGRKAKISGKEELTTSAMQAAVSAAMKHSKQPRVNANQWLTNLWLGRICKTAAHELGHCVSLDHCVYYACLMQGTAGLSEDARQPPFFCPVDTAKLLRTTGSSEEAWLQALLRFCQWFERDRLFAASAAWLEVRLREIAQKPKTEAGRDGERNEMRMNLAHAEVIDLTMSD